MNSGETSQNISLREHIADLLNIPIELAMNAATLIVYGNRSLIAEQHKGIREYTEQRIAFRTGQGLVIVEGKELCLKRLNGTELVIEGELFSIGLGEEKS